MAAAGEGNGPTGPPGPAGPPASGGAEPSPSGDGRFRAFCATPTGGTLIFAVQAGTALAFVALLAGPRSPMSDSLSVIAFLVVSLVNVLRRRTPDRSGELVASALAMAALVVLAAMQGTPPTPFLLTTGVLFLLLAGAERARRAAHSVVPPDEPRSGPAH
jgi:hypothetical protein